MGRPLIIGHRGHPVGAPEQTLASYEVAARLGADIIEADVRRSSDGRLVMMHDATLDRTTDGHGHVAAQPYDRLRELDAGSWFSPGFAGARVPSLDELFELAFDLGVALCLEAKGETAQEAAATAMATAREIAGRGRLATDYLASFDHAALATACTDVPGLRTAPDRLPERGLSSVESLVAQARAAGAELIQHHCSDLRADVVAGLHEAGLAVWAWPTNTPDEIVEALQLGVDAVMGDDVAALVAAVGPR
jgi:glycerophosphoryl diester phosphodiesterase